MPNYYVLSEKAPRQVTVASTQKEKAEGPRSRCWGAETHKKAVFRKGRGEIELKRKQTQWNDLERAGLCGEGTSSPH